MRSHRLSRLTLLTQGIALIGFGMSELACSKAPQAVNGPAPEELHMNAPPLPPAPQTQAADGAATTLAAPDGSTPPENLTHANATAVAPGADASVAAPPTLRPPMHVNAPYRKP